jgi:GTPase Era involved in 16S rRNA processing
VKQEEVAAADLKISQPSAEELEKIVYLQKLDALNEKKYSDNLIFFLRMVLLILRSTSTFLREITMISALKLTTCATAATSLRACLSENAVLTI